jgi:cysteine desulfurase
MAANPVNLDANASVPPLPEAREALLAAAEVGANPSSPHALGRAARRVLDRSRDALAEALNAKSHDVFFTSGASEGNRWWVDALVEKGRRSGERPRVLSTPLEHPSLAKRLGQAASAGDLELHLAIVEGDGSLVWEKGLFEKADALFCTAAHNETGLLPDLTRIGGALNENALFVVDASQHLAREKNLPDRADGVVVSAHKIGGFAGTGAVVCRGRARDLPAPWAGGGQESGLRPGTEALTLIAAFGAAAQSLDRTRDRCRTLSAARDQLEKGSSRPGPGAGCFLKKRRVCPRPPPSVWTVWMARPCA